jgi:hypothetical protein
MKLLTEVIYLFAFVLLLSFNVSSMAERSKVTEFKPPYGLSLQLWVEILLTRAYERAIQLAYKRSVILTTNDHIIDGNVIANQN